MTIVAYIAIALLVMKLVWNLGIPFVLMFSTEYKDGDKGISPMPIEFLLAGIASLSAYFSSGKLQPYSVTIFLVAIASICLCHLTIFGVLFLGTKVFENGMPKR